MSRIACKFGGSSVADHNQFLKIRKIIQANPKRTVIVPSAPGKRHSGEAKITDLLYLCHDMAQKKVALDGTFTPLRDRYLEIESGPGAQGRHGRRPGAAAPADRRGRHPRLRGLPRRIPVRPPDGGLPGRRVRRSRRDRLLRQDRPHRSQDLRDAGPAHVGPEEALRAARLLRRGHQGARQDLLPRRIGHLRRHRGAGHRGRAVRELDRRERPAHGRSRASWRTPIPWTR